MQTVPIIHLDCIFHGSYAWRTPVIIQCVILIAMLLLTTMLPESPRRLVAHDHTEDSLMVFRRVHAVVLDDDENVKLRDSIIKVVEEELAINSGSWKSVL